MDRNELKSEKISKTFCVMPWKGVNINPKGYYTPCCTSDFKIADSNEVGIKEAWNHPNYKAIRKDMLEGVWHPACYECELREADTIHSASSYKSARHNFNSDRIFEKAWDKLVLSESPPLDLVEVEVDFGNLCNLKCNMCGSHNSTSWVEDEKALGRFREEDFVHRKPPDEEKYAKYLEAFSKVDVLRFKGGEPFLVKTPMRILKDLVSYGLTKKRVHFVTNGTLVKPEHFETLNHFEWVDFEVSLDATGTSYQYMRGGRKFLFSFLENQLKMIRKNLNPKKSQLTINSVYQNLNSFDILEFTRWFHEFAVESPVRLSLIRSVLTGPEIYLASNMPNDLKEKAENLIDKSLEFLENNPKPEKFVTWARVPKVLEDCRKALKRDFDPELWDEFLNYTKKLDVIRQMPLGEFNPEYQSLFKERDLNA